MPRSQRGYGRPDTPVVPAGWDTSHAAVITATFPDLVSLRAPSSLPPAWNPGTNRTEVPRNTPFATNVPARIAAIGADAGVTTNDDVVRVAGYHVYVPLDAAGVDQVVVNGESDTLVDVVASADPLLAGRTLQVTGVVRGSTRFERNILTTLND